MKKYGFIVFSFIILFTSFAHVPSEKIWSWDEPYFFNNKKTILLFHGDSPDFIQESFDDSLWEQISFPLNKKDLTLFSQTEKEIYWYRIHFTLPTECPFQSIGINLGKIADVDEVWWNGTPIGNSGSVDDLKSHASNRLRQYEIPSTLLKLGEDNVLSIRVRNTWRADELPGRGNYYIGSFTKMRTDFFKSSMRELIFPIIYIVFFAYFLLLYSKRTGQKENLIYSIFSFFFAIYSFCRTDIKYEYISNFNILQKFEFGSMYFCISLFMAFVLIYFEEKHRLYHYAYYLFTLISLVILSFLNNHLHWYYLNVYFVQYTWVFPVYFSFKTLIKNYQKSADARIMIITFVFVCLAIGHDIILSRGYQVVPFINLWITPFAMFIFVAGIAMILSVRFANSMNKIEELNETLELKVEERTAELDNSLQEIRSRDEKIHHELVMAGNVQKSLLPELLPSDWPVRTAVRYKPLREVSGDFYNFVRTNDGGYLMYIGDVSGHGMPAALYSILALKAYNEAIITETLPSKILSKVNDELCRFNTTHYLTSFLVKYDGKHTIQIVNAGHPRGILLNRIQKKIKMLDTSGTIIGIRDDAETFFKNKTIPFESGDCILLYTDCLTERTNSEGEQFGEKRLLESIKKYFYEDINNLLDKVLADYNNFVGDSENKDDLTIVVMEKK